MGVPTGWTSYRIHLDGREAVDITSPPGGPVLWVGQRWRSGSERVRFVRIEPLAGIEHYYAVFTEPDPEESAGAAPGSADYVR